jgi:DNA-binding PadR family transcriptional regulator
MMAGHVLSELEGVVLGVVWKFGPCTPHAIRSHFFASRSARFSGSAGAIYPLVARLERAALLHSQSDRRSRQRRRLYEITPAGRRRLVTWLSPPFREQDVGALHDPIRTRVYFLAALPARERRRFLDEAEAGLRRTLDLMKQDLVGYRRAGSHLSVLAMRGAIGLARAQLRWLVAIREDVLRLGASDGD